MAEQAELAPRRQRRRQRHFWRDDPFERMREEMDSVLSHYLKPLPVGRLLEGRVGGELELPTDLDLSETDDALEVVLDVPGVKESDIKISLSDNRLSVKGERKSETEKKEKNFHRIERSYGAFERTVTLPCEVEADKVAAKLKDGVLTITLPKAAAGQESSRAIPIEKG